MYVISSESASKIVRNNSSKLISDKNAFIPFLHEALNSTGIPVDMIVMANGVNYLSDDVDLVLSGFCNESPSLADCWCGKWEKHSSADVSCWEAMRNIPIGRAIRDRDLINMRVKPQRELQLDFEKTVGKGDIAVVPVARTWISASIILFYKIGKGNLFNKPELIELGYCCDAINFLLRKSEMENNFLRI